MGAGMIYAAVLTLGGLALAIIDFALDWIAGNRPWFGRGGAGDGGGPGKMR